MKKTQAESHMQVHSQRIQRYHELASHAEQEGRLRSNHLDTPTGVF